MSMKVVVGYPPNYKEIVRVLGRPPRGAVFTWGDTIFNPDGGSLDEALLVHEATHARQHAAVGGPEAWWQRYLVDRPFRRNQEVEAYRLQYACACRLYGNRSVRRRTLKVLAGHLASAMYGQLLSRREAEVAIAGAA